MTINVWSDSMQHIELLGKPALFSDSRVDRSTVPDGWYVYDLRGSDYDPDLISTLEARVIVNYAGSILTPEPVIFPDGQDYLDVKGQTDFLDEEITLIDFCRQHEMPIPSRYQIRPASFDEAGLFYAMKPEEDQRLGCIGHVRMDFGHRGKEFWHTWWPRGPEELNSPEFKAELQQVVDELHTGVLKDLSSMSKYCWSHGGEVGNWPSNYGYIVETENYRYCLRCNPVPGDYQAYLTAFDLRVQRQNLAEQAAAYLGAAEKPDFDPLRRDIVHLRELPIEERQRLAAENPAYGNIVCRCEGISEGEIVDAIRRTPGARSLDGVKRRVRAGMGRCQGGFCTPRVMEILSRELGVPQTELTKNGGASRLLAGRTKEEA